MKRYAVSIIPCSKVKFRAPDSMNSDLSQMMANPMTMMGFEYGNTFERTSLSQFDDAKQIIEFAKKNSIRGDIYDEEYVSVWVTCIQDNNGDELHAPEFEVLPTKVPFSLFIGKQDHDCIRVTDLYENTIDIECNQNLLPTFVITEVLNLLRSNSNDNEFTARNIYNMFEKICSKMDDPFAMAVKQEYVFDNPNSIKAARARLRKCEIEVHRAIEKNRKLSEQTALEKSNPFNDDFPDGLPGRTN